MMVGGLEDVFGLPRSTGSFQISGSSCFATGLWFFCRRVGQILASNWRFALVCCRVSFAACVSASFLHTASIMRVARTKKDMDAVELELFAGLGILEAMQECLAEVGSACERCPKLKCCPNTASGHLYENM